MEGHHPRVGASHPIPSAECHVQEGQHHQPAEDGVGGENDPENAKGLHMAGDARIRKRNHAGEAGRHGAWSGWRRRSRHSIRRTTLRAVRLCPNGCATLTAIHVRPLPFPGLVPGSLEDTPLPPNLFPLFSSHLSSPSSHLSPIDELTLHRAAEVRRIRAQGKSGRFRRQPGTREQVFGGILPQGSPRTPVLTRFVFC